jgi:RNA polymerase sigma-70 factor (family 1)
MTSSCDLDERKLIAQLRENDKQAYLALYNRYHRGVYAFIVRYVKINAVAEDLLQDVFLKLWEVRHRLNPELSFSSYLYRIARNRVFKMLKALANDEALRHQVLNSMQQSVLEVEDRVQWKKYSQLLNLAINTLPPQRQKVFKLCREQGKTYEQVAEELHISRHTVKEHMMLAIRDIKNYVSSKADLPLATLLLVLSLL